MTFAISNHRVKGYRVYFNKVYSWTGTGNWISDTGTMK